MRSIKYLRNDKVKFKENLQLLSWIPELTGVMDSEVRHGLAKYVIPHRVTSTYGVLVYGDGWPIDVKIDIYCEFAK